LRYPPPGTAVIVDFGIYKHLGIVTDQWYEEKPMVISNSYRRRGVYEEPWDAFSCNNEVCVHRLLDSTDYQPVLDRARSKTGTRWNLLVWNCEHFVSWVCGRKSHSPQLKSALMSITIVAGTTLLTRYVKKVGFS